MTRPLDDPDLLIRGVDIFFDVDRRVIRLCADNAISESDGLLGRTLYSFCKEEWKCPTLPGKMPDLVAYDFPFIAYGCVDRVIGLTLQDGWTIDPDSLRLLRRTFICEEGDPSHTHSFVSSDMRANQWSALYGPNDESGS